MKKLIALIVLVIIVWGILKIAGIGFSVSPPDKLMKRDRTGETLTMMLARSSYEDIIGFSLPKTASEIRYYKWQESVILDFNTSENVTEVFCWVVANLPEKDFDFWVDDYDLTSATHLLKSRPDILACQVGAFRHWDLKKGMIDNVYFNESDEFEEYIICTYTNRKVYIKKVITYSEGQDENKEWYYEKLAKDR